MASLDVLPAALNLLVSPLCQLLATCTRLSWHPGKIKVFRIAIFLYCNNIHDQLRASFNCCQLLRRLLPEAKAVVWKLGAQRTPWSAVANHKRTAALISKNIVLIKWSISCNLCIHLSTQPPQQQPLRSAFSDQGTFMQSAARKREIRRKARTQAIGARNERHVESEGNILEAASGSSGVAQWVSLSLYSATVYLSQ
jgi:hypothetical protein